MEQRDYNQQKYFVTEQEELLALLLAKEGFAPSTIPSIVPQKVDQDIPLSFAQQRLWFLEHWEPGNPLYNIMMAYHLSGPLNETALEQSFHAIVQRHEVLRTTFHLKNDQAVQIVNSIRTTPFTVDDLISQVDKEQKESINRLLLQEERCPFDLTQGPLIRMRLLRLNESEHILLLTIHHLVFDSWSKDILLRELSHTYNIVIGGQQSSLPALPLRYADFTIWQREWLRGSRLEKLIAYWKQRLEGALPVLELPTSRPRPMIRTLQGAHFTFWLPDHLVDKLPTGCATR